MVSATKNYYVILGVATGATLEEIKTAFRRRALELHPDTSGLQSEPFLEVQEAYRVLSDPVRRRRYDERKREPIARHRPWGPPPEPLGTERPKAEPFRPAETAGGFREFLAAHAFARHAPALDELFDRWWSDFASVQE